MALSKTIKPYKVKAYGYEITIPTGSIVGTMTACGNDMTYHFWQDFRKIAEELTGFKNSLLKHDLTYYGINVPSEYCKPYETKEK